MLLQNIQAVLQSSWILSERQNKELIWPEVEQCRWWDVDHEL
jgi:hypothetical protein